MQNCEKPFLNEFQKSKSWEAEHNLYFKMENIAVKMFKKTWSWLWKKVGYHCTKNEVFQWGFLQEMWPNPQKTADLVTFTKETLNGKIHFFCVVCFISFIIFVLKTTRMYFDLTYYYHTNLYVFLLWLNFQRNKTNKVLV